MLDSRLYQPRTGNLAITTCMIKLFQLCWTSSAHQHGLVDNVEKGNKNKGLNDFSTNVYWHMKMGV